MAITMQVQQNYIYCDYSSGIEINFGYKILAKTYYGSKKLRFK